MIDYSYGYIYITNNGRTVGVNASTCEEELVSGTPEAKTINGPIDQADFVKPTSVAFSPDKNSLCSRCCNW